MVKSDELGVQGVEALYGPRRLGSRSGVHLDEGKQEEQQHIRNLQYKWKLPFGGKKKSLGEVPGSEDCATREIAKKSQERMATKAIFAGLKQEKGWQEEC